MAKRTARRDYGSGAVYRKHDKRYGCPPAVETVSETGKKIRRRPDHDKTCRAPWAATVEIGWTRDGTKPDGTPKYRRNRKPITDKDKGRLIEKLRKLDPDTATTNVPTVEQWLTTWLDEIIVHKTSPKGLQSYRWAVHTHLIPHLGKRRVNELTPAHIMRLHQTLRAKPKAPGRGDGTLSSTSVQRVHACLSAALNDAAPFNYLPARGNPCEMIDRPRAAVAKLDELTAEQAANLLRHVARHPLGSRWAFALLTGQRQGECLGLRWSQLTLDPVLGAADVAWQLQRIGWRHGCLGDTGGSPNIRGEKEGTPCGRRFGGNCPDRELDINRDDYEHEVVEGGLCLVRPKGDSRKLVPVIAPLVAWLRRRHLEAAPTPHDLVWTRERGRPIDPRADWQAWLDLLDDCGLPRVRLHSARHTCVSLLYAMSVHEPVIQQIVGHSVVATTRGYRNEDLGPARRALGQLGDMLELPQLPGR